MSDNIPKASALYNLKPIGIGSSFVESITSYISRLAEAHSVVTSTLFNKIIVPALNKDFPLQTSLDGSTRCTKGSRYYADSSCLNGVGRSSQELIEALESLTLRNDISSLSMFDWKEIIPAKDLVRTSRSWCPSCFEERRNNGNIIYEPLLWTIKVVTVCPRHHTKLINICPVCKRSNFVLSSKSRVGFCSCCGSWLAQDISKCNSSQADIDNLDCQLFVSENVGQLLATAHVSKEDSYINNFRGNLDNFINNISNGNLRVFERMTGILRVNIRFWRTGNNRPSLNWLIKIAYSAGVRVTDLLLRKDLDINVVYHKVERDRRSKRNLNITEMGILINKYLSDRVPVSLETVANTLEVNKKILYAHFYDECKAISSRYMKEVKRCKEVGILKKKSIIEDAVISLCQQGVYPSMKNIQEYTGQNGLSKNRELYRFWSNIINSKKNKKI